MEDDCVSFGRSSSCEVRLASRYVSRVHARLIKCDDGYVLEDEGSHNGTRVNGEPIEGSVSVGDGDVIQIGNFAITMDEINTSGFLAAQHSSAILSASHI